MDQLKSHEVFPGFHGKFIHSDTMTLAFWEIRKGASVPLHAHVHEQIVNVMEGEFEMVVDGKASLLKAGTILVIPSHAQHSGTAITACRILDIFSPVRKDYILD